MGPPHPTTLPAQCPPTSIRDSSPRAAPRPLARTGLHSQPPRPPWRCRRWHRGAGRGPGCGGRCSAGSSRRAGICHQRQRGGRGRAPGCTGSLPPCAGTESPRVPAPVPQRSGTSSGGAEDRGGAASPACPRTNSAQPARSTHRGLASGGPGIRGTRPGWGAHAALGLGEGLALPGLCMGHPQGAGGQAQTGGLLGRPLDAAQPTLARVSCTQPLPRGPARFSSPEVGLQHPVQALVERPRGEVACPVVILPVRIGEEIPSQHWEPRRLHPRHNAHLLV